MNNSANFSREFFGLVSAGVHAPKTLPPNSKSPKSSAFLQPPKFWKILSFTPIFCLRGRVTNRELFVSVFYSFQLHWCQRISLWFNRFTSIIWIDCILSHSKRTWIEKAAPTMARYLGSATMDTGPVLLPYRLTPATHDPTLAINAAGKWSQIIQATPRLWRIWWRQ